MYNSLNNFALMPLIEWSTNFLVPFFKFLVSIVQFVWDREIVQISILVMMSIN